MSDIKCDPFEDFLRMLPYHDTVTLSLEGCGATSWDTRTIHNAIMRRLNIPDAELLQDSHSWPDTPPAASAWRTDEPPRDGREFLAFDRFGVVTVLEWKSGYFYANRTPFPAGFIIAWAEIHPYWKIGIDLSQTPDCTGETNDKPCGGNGDGI